MDNYTFMGTIGMRGAQIVGSGDTAFLSISFGVKTKIHQPDGTWVDGWKNVEGTWSKFPRNLVQYLLPKTRVVVEMINPIASTNQGKDGKTYNNIRGSIIRIHLTDASPWKSSEQTSQASVPTQPTPQVKKEPLPNFNNNEQQPDLPF